MKHVIDSNFIFQQYSALMLIAFNTVQLQQCKTFIFISFWAIKKWPQNGPQPNFDDYKSLGATQQQQDEL